MGNWDKLGNPARPKKCAVCCGRYSDSLGDPDTCSISAGFYPNGAQNIFLELSFTSFQPAATGHFDRDALKDAEYQDAEGAIECNPFPFDNNGIPQNLVVVSHEMSFQPFTVELIHNVNIAQASTACEYRTPNYPDNPTASVTGTSLADVETQMENLGFVEVQEAAFEDILDQLEILPNGSNSYHYTNDWTFGKVYASVDVKLYTNRPEFLIELYQVRGKVETREEFDSDGDPVGSPVVTESYSALKVFGYTEMPSLTGPTATEIALAKRFKCAEAPVFIGADTTFWPPQHTRGDSSTFMVPAEDLDEPDHLYATPYIISPFDTGSGDSRPETAPPSPPFFIEDWPASRVATHADYDAPNGSTLMVLDGPIPIGSRFPRNTTGGVPDCGSPVDIEGDAEHHIHIQGLEDLRVTLLNPGEVIA